MKTLKKMLALVTTLAVVFTMLVATGLTAFAADGDTSKVTITVERDASYDASATGDREFTAYKVFDATYDSNTATGGGSNNGVPGDIDNSGSGFSYTLPADSSLIATLGTWNATSKAWTKATGNLWFDLRPSADGTKYVVSWDEDVQATADNVQAAAAWLIANNVYQDTTTLTYSAADKKWSAEVDKGYYVISSSEGKNLVAATTDINIKEKNTYPTVEKLQKDEDASAYADTKLNVAIGDEIEYQVTVKVPADANKDIVLTDTMTAGVEYDTTTSLTFSPSLTANTDYVKGTESATGWTVTIKPTANTKGKDIVITYKAKAVAAVLTDATRKNTVELKYNGDHYVMTDDVEFTTYFSGIHKIDGDTKGDLAGVEFTLKEAGTEFKVSKDSAGYYIPDANGSATVTTDASGLIKIRGIDKDKKYTLTETKPLDGYNPIEGDVTLNLTEDKGTAYDDVKDSKTADAWTPVENNKGAVLPSTGGIGTTIFYILGSLLVVGCGIVLISKKRTESHK